MSADRLVGIRWTKRETEGEKRPRSVEPQRGGRGACLLSAAASGIERPLLRALRSTTRRAPILERPLERQQAKSELTSPRAP
jgi:hypothetical protein